MKNFNVIMLAIIAIAPTTIFAAGDHIVGSIWIDKASYNTYLWADLNVRWNVGPSGGGYVLMNGYANDRVFVSAQDQDGQVFSCVIEVDSPYYERSVDVKNNFTVGGTLWISKSNNSNDCLEFTFGKYSSLQN